jgi:hypothetical protein
MRRHPVVLMAVASALAAGALATCSGSTAGPHRAGAGAPHRVVPLSVQRLIRKRVPLEPYIPAWLPRGYHYVEHENLSWRGFDLYFARKDGVPLLGWDVVRTQPGSCNQGPGQRTIHLRGVVVHYSGEPSHGDQSAWRCLTRRGIHVLVTAHTVGPNLVRQYGLAQMNATLRRIVP